jgi:hypothetical protein
MAKLGLSKERKNGSMLEKPVDVIYHITNGKRKNAQLF